MGDSGREPLRKTPEKFHRVLLGVFRGSFLPENWGAESPLSPLSSWTESAFWLLAALSRTRIGKVARPPSSATPDPDGFALSAFSPCFVFTSQGKKEQPVTLLWGTFWSKPCTVLPPLWCANWPLILVTAISVPRLQGSGQWFISGASGRNRRGWLACGLWKVCHKAGSLIRKACAHAEGQSGGEKRFLGPSAWSGLKTSHYVTQMACSVWSEWQPKQANPKTLQLLIHRLPTPAPSHSLSFLTYLLPRLPLVFSFSLSNRASFKEPLW